MAKYKVVIRQTITRDMVPGEFDPPAFKFSPCEEIVEAASVVFAHGAIAFFGRTTTNGESSLIKAYAGGEWKIVERIEEDVVAR